MPNWPIRWESWHLSALGRVVVVRLTGVPEPFDRWHIRRPVALTGRSHPRAARTHGAHSRAERSVAAMRRAIRKRSGSGARVGDGPGEDLGPVLEVAEPPVAGRARRQQDHAPGRRQLAG